MMQTPMQPVMQQPMQQPAFVQTAVVVPTQPTAVAAPKPAGALGVPAYSDGFWPDNSVSITCHECGQHTMTDIRKQQSILPWILCIVLFVVGLWPCMCCPFC